MGHGDGMDNNSKQEWSFENLWKMCFTGKLCMDLK